MTEEFKTMPFFGKLRVNPEYGVQAYPIPGTAPDMALPNIVGNFFYSKGEFTPIIEKNMRIG